MTTTEITRKLQLAALAGVAACTLAAMPVTVGYHADGPAFAIADTSALASEGDHEGSEHSGGDDGGHSSDSSGGDDGGHSSDSSGGDDGGHSSDSSGGDGGGHSSGSEGHGDESGHGSSDSSSTDGDGLLDD